ncbi:hypothetical protein [Peribacillus frigoritolerans]|uniref:hypothetical protein n=1 Tax=Peribacillus frigoritolerans TaxID=450367 RepID=UPI002282F2A5|nr:hypothetical protein [Peribacillus frigoritolerans]MCY9139116.1 hypothetical protein [Peribacillus frigoritolerans]
MMSFVDLIWIILIMVIKIIFSKSVSGSDEYASFIDEDVKTFIKKIKQKPGKDINWRRELSPEIEEICDTPAEMTGYPCPCEAWQIGSRL